MMTVKSRSLARDFRTYFEVGIANEKPVDLDAIMRVRYRVYCQEFQYEAEDALASGRETDSFDAQAVHCLIRHIATGTPAGCIRVVTVNEDTVMPMERYCSESFDPSLTKPLMANRNDICEISRLAVDPAFRRRSGEHATRFGDPQGLKVDHSETRVFPLISVAAFLSATAVGDLIGRRHCFAMMEPFLPRMLARAGIVARRIGKDMEYHGTRAPYCMKTDDALTSMSAELRDLYEHIRAEFGIIESC